MNKNIIDTINESAELALGTSAMESKMEEASAILEYMPAVALNPTIGMNPTPIYTTGELEKLAFCDDPKFNKYGIEATNKELAKKFKDTFATFYSGIMPENIDEVREQWVDAVVAEQKQLGGDDDKVHRQNIVALGWHPDFDILKADWPALNQITTNKIMEEYQYDGSSIIDICEFVKLADGETKKSRKSSPRKRNLNPVYITLISGQKQAISSSLIRWWTKGPFCHAAIGFRHTLDDLKSYNTAKYNGLSDESLEFFTPEERIAVYTIFVEDEDMKAIKRNLDYYIDNRDKTTYSRLNIASIVLGVPLNFQFDMVCSQFVDRILKFAKIDITGKDSSLVSPNDFWKASKNNKKMYKVYDGKVGDYKPNKVKAAIDRLLASSRTKTIKECVEYLLEAKATYSRPYTRDEIRDAYGDGKLTELMGDPAHEWRADTGIELIHPEPTEKELDRIWVNWNAMTPEQKKASDKKCKEIFNKSNTRLYAELKAVWKYKRDRGEIEEGADIINEKYFISTDNIELNLDEWKPLPGKNLLHITGLSGAGKSTLMRKLREKYDCEVIEIDAFTLKQIKGPAASKPGLGVHPFIEEYFATHDVPKSSNWETDESKLGFSDFYNWLDQKISLGGNEHKLYIIEGAQIMVCLKPEILVDKPVIIIGTSMITSIWRRTKRDLNKVGERDDWFVHNLRMFLRLLKPSFIKRYVNSERSLQKFMNDLEVKNKDFEKNDGVLGITIAEEGAAIINEGLIVTEKDIENNVEKWKPGTNNILYVTGLSGSGKTTLGEEYEKTYKARLFEIDGIEHNYDSTNSGILDKAKAKFPDYKKICDDHSFSSLTDNEASDLILKVLKFCTGEMKKDSENLYIIEGIQIFELLDPAKMKSKPLIIKGTSTIRSLVRGYNRDKENGSDPKFFERLAWLVQDSKHLAKFKRGIKEECEYIDYVPLYPVLETKEFPVQFDEDGNLTIKNYRKLDYNREYQLSHQAIKADMKANQIESLKYELSKLWFLNTVILVKIHDEKIKEEEKTELTKIRAWILNDFNTGLKFVTEREPRFNFSKYYEDSPYSDVRIKINAHTIRGVVDLIKYIVK